MTTHRTTKLVRALTHTGYPITHVLFNNSGHDFFLGGAKPLLVPDLEGREVRSVFATPFLQLAQRAIRGEKYLVATIPDNQIFTARAVMAAGNDAALFSSISFCSSGTGTLVHEYSATCWIDIAKAGAREVWFSGIIGSPLFGEDIGYTVVGVADNNFVETLLDVAERIDSIKNTPKAATTDPKVHESLLENLKLAEVIVSLSAAAKAMGVDLGSEAAPSITYDKNKYVCFAPHCGYIADHTLFGDETSWDIKVAQLFSENEKRAQERVFDKHDSRYAFFQVQVGSDGSRDVVADSLAEETPTSTGSESTCTSQGVSAPLTPPVAPPVVESPEK